jgi:hypothetical protein
MERRIPELFVPFLPHTETTVYSFEDAINTIEQSYSYKEVGAYAHDIKMDQQTIAVHGKDYHATRWGIESLFKMFGISKATIFRLAPDHLIDLINKVLRGQQDRIHVFLDQAETKIINVVKAPYYRARNAAAIKMLQDLDPKYSWNHKEIGISERGIGLSLVTDLFRKIEPLVGDITKTGFHIVNSDTGGRPLKASFFLFRLMCENGTVLRDKWGEARWTYDNRIPWKESLRAFGRKLQGMQLPTELLERKYDALLNNRLTDLDFRKIWRNLSRSVGPEGADSILEIEEEERKRILRTLKEREERNRKSLDPNAERAPVSLDRNFHEILQLVTAKARNYPLPTKEALEKLGGKIIG